MAHWPIFSGVFLFVWSLGIASAESQTPGTKAMENDRPALACRFATQVKQHEAQARNTTHEWHLWRQADVVEIRDVDGKSGQIWRRDKDGQVSYQRVFHTARRVVEYYPSDLRALQSYPEWQKLTSVIDPALLGSALAAKEEVLVLNRPARRYTGTVEDQEFDILWLEQEHLPARVHRKSKGYEEIMELKEIHPLASSSWPRNETVGYESIDYADLGDKESDPFVRAFLHAGGREHHH